MKPSLFLFISAILSFIFGAMMFFIPKLAATSLGIGFTSQTASLLRGMGGLIIGFGTLNYLVRKNADRGTLRIVFLTNIITNVLGLLADILGVLDGALKTSKMAPVEITHLFIAIGSLIYLVRMKNISKR